MIPLLRCDRRKTSSNILGWLLFELFAHDTYTVDKSSLTLEPKTLRDTRREVHFRSSLTSQLVPFFFFYVLCPNLEKEEFGCFCSRRRMIIDGTLESRCQLTLKRDAKSLTGRGVYACRTLQSSRRGGDLWHRLHQRYAQAPTRPAGQPNAG